MTDRFVAIAGTTAILIAVLAGSILFNRIIDGWIGFVAGVVWGGFMGWHADRIVAWLQDRFSSTR